MEEKQSLYELLGLNDKASPEDIQSAFEKCRQALARESDSEERRNRLNFLQHAHGVLIDRRQRAAYDRRVRDRRAAVRAPPPTQAFSPVVAVLLIAAAAYPVWLYVARVQPVAELKEAPTRAPVIEMKPEPAAVAVSEDIVALLPPAPLSVATPGATPKAAIAPQPDPKKLNFNVPYDAALAKFSESTYYIIGGAGSGTGVAIDHDKVLTNCHVIAPNVLKGALLAINPTTGSATRITAAAFLITEDACVAHAPGLNGKPIAFGNASQLAKGAPIFNIGFANGQLISSAGVLLGVINRGGQPYLVSSNYCDQGVSGGPLVNVDGRLVGLTSGGPRDRSFCLSLTAETARTVLSQTLIAIDAFPPNYLSNLVRRW